MRQSHRYSSHQPISKINCSLCQRQNSNKKMARLNKNLQQAYFSPNNKRKKYHPKHTQSLSLKIPIKEQDSKNSPILQNKSTCLQTFVQSKVYRIQPIIRQYKSYLKGQYNNLYFEAESPYKGKKRSKFVLRHKRLFTDPTSDNNIVKLPQKYQKKRLAILMHEIPSVPRMCRQKINKTQIQKPLKNNSYNVKGNNSFGNRSPNKYNRFSKHKINSLKTIESNGVNEKQQEQITYPNGLQTKFHKEQISEEEYIQHTQKNNTVQEQLENNDSLGVTKMLQLIQAQQKKQNQIEKIKNKLLRQTNTNQEQTGQKDRSPNSEGKLHQIPAGQYTNPLKSSKTQYQKQQLKYLNKMIKNCVMKGVNYEKKKIFDLPRENFVHIYVKNYEPIYNEINLQKLIFSSAFEIQRQNQWDSQKLYFGQFLNQKYHGTGIMITQYQIRQGTWENGEMIKGIIKNQYQFYKGEMKNGLKHGYGQSYYQDGGLYEGYWQDDKKHGEGYYKHSNCNYVGQWKFGLFQGKGVLKTHFSVYEGKFKNCYKQGYGQQTFTNSDYYQGIFKQDQPEGQGKYYWKSGLYYEGNFVQGRRQGEGIFVAPGIVEYKGYFKNDRPSGAGKAYYINGDEYHGMFFKGLKNGQGDLICKRKKVVYSGDWVNDTLAFQLKLKK